MELCVVFHTIVVVTTLMKSVKGNSGVVMEYCNHETFNPSCTTGEIIIMQSAFYGRMRLGTCLDESFGYLGCSANILSQMDQQCSGKQSCEVLIATIQEQLNCTAPKTLTRYLEASYICKRQTPVPSDNCKMDLKSRRYSLTSTTVMESGCGQDSMPFILQAKPGQKINVSMIDFNWNAKHENLIGCIQRFSYFVDGDKVFDICGKTKRQKHLLLSSGNVLQLVLDRSVETFTYILTFEVIGCPTFESPKDTWIKESNNIVTVGCTHNDKTWKMRCIGNHWIGIVGKCEKGLDDERNSQDKALRKEDSVLGLPPTVGFSLIGAVFLVILCVMVTVVIGFFCIRKSKPDKKDYYMTPIPPSYCPTLPLEYRTVNTRPRDQDGNRTLINVPASHQRTLLTTGNNEHNDLIQNTSSPNYFVLENREKEPIYDAVYQNITDTQNA